MPQGRKKPVALFLSNYHPEYVISARARYFAEAIQDLYETVIIYRIGTIQEAFRDFVRAIWVHRPHFIYVMELGLAGGIAALITRALRRTSYIVDTGGGLYDSLRLRRRPRWQWVLADQIERMIYGKASAVAVRGTLQKIIYEARYYNPNIFLLPESVDTSKWFPKQRPDLRARYQLNNVLTIGMMGSLKRGIGTTAWGPVHDWTTGQEVIEVLRILQDEPVKGVLLPVRSIHGGSKEGEVRLGQLAEEYGVKDRLVIIPNIPREEIPDYLSIIDVCFSTQLGNPLGEMHISAKLPDYLACGKFVLASKVGEARLILPPEMLVDYSGGFDPGYPNRLAERVKQILANPQVLELGKEMVHVAKEKFDFMKVAEDARQMILEVIPMGH